MSCHKPKSKGPVELPEQVVKLFDVQQFKDNYSQEQVLAFYEQFQVISQSKPGLSRQKMREMLFSMGVNQQDFSNKPISDLIFDIVDQDDSGMIDFTEFMIYIQMLTEGEAENKADFIFRMISKDQKRNRTFFKYDELNDFFNMIFMSDNDDLELDTIQQIDSNFLKEQNKFCDFVYQKIKKESKERVTLSEFRQFFKEGSNSKYFNFLANKSLKKSLMLDKTIGTIQQRIKGIRNELKNVITFYEIHSVDFQSQQFSIDRLKQIESNIDHFRPINGISSEHQIKPSKDIPKTMQVLDHKLTQLEKYIDNEMRRKNLLEGMSNVLKKKKTNPKKYEKSKSEVFFGNPNWHIVQNLIQGIQKSLAIIETEKVHIISFNDFTLENNLELSVFYKNKSEKVLFTDYAPYVFDKIRKNFGINIESYLGSIGISIQNEAFLNKLQLMLSEQSTGKSGSFFFQSSDEKYLIKTISEEEHKVLLRILSKYYQHIQNHKDTLISKYYGLHRLQIYQSNKRIYNVYICIMNNVFDISEDTKIAEIFDLKGSTYKRLTKKDKIDKGAAGKDLNFLQTRQFIELNKTPEERSILDIIEDDATFLEKNKIIDYSLLVGIQTLTPNEKRNQSINSELNLEEQSKIIGVKGKIQNEEYFIGIIDTLTYYGLRKTGEYLFKRVAQGKGASCVPPDQYKKRFVNFMKQAIKVNVKQQN